MTSPLVTRAAHLALGAFSLATLALAPVAAQQGAADPHMTRALRILRTTPLIDGHNDLPWYIREEVKSNPRDVDAYDLRTHTSGNTDIARLRKGMVGGQFWSVYVPGEVKDSGYARIQLEQIDIARRIIAKYPDVFLSASTVADVRRAKATGKIGSMLGMEGGHAIENSLGALRAYYDLGARYMTLTHNVTLDWADAALDSAKHNGLTKFGEEVVREMNRLGMLVDLSHVSPAVMSDALNVAEAPVIFSHSAARALTDVPRNVPDSILARLPKNGGVVMVAFVPGFVSQPIATYEKERAAESQAAMQRARPDSMAWVAAMKQWDAAHARPVSSVKDVADHIEHIRKVAGVNHVGFGSDFDGTGNDLPEGLKDVSTFPVILAELSRRGWSDADLRKVAGENLLRAWAQAERVSARLKKERKASNKTIQELDGKGPKM
jgi:membrane dipeptidase